MSAARRTRQSSVQHGGLTGTATPGVSAGAVAVVTAYDRRQRLANLQGYC